MSILWVFLTCLVLMGTATLIVFRKELALAWQEIKEEKKKKEVFFKNNGVKFKEADPEMSNTSGNGMD